MQIVIIIKNQIKTKPQTTINKKKEEKVEKETKKYTVNTAKRKKARKCCRESQLTWGKMNESSPWQSCLNHSIKKEKMYEKNFLKMYVIIGFQTW